MEKNSNDEVLFSVASPETTEGQVCDMLDLYENRDKVFVKGAPKMNENKSGEENVMGLHPSVKISQVYADECMMDLADSPESKNT
jgi:hypothetical protein